MILKVGRWRKRSTVLMTPFFSNRVCQAMVLSRKFIHIGMMKIRTMSWLLFPFNLLKIMARG